MDVLVEVAKCLESLPSDLLLLTASNGRQFSLYHGTFVAEISVGAQNHAYRVSLLGGTRIIASGRADTLEGAVDVSLAMLRGLRAGVNASAASLSCQA
jgi:hypothetical protein